MAAAAAAAAHLRTCLRIQYGTYSCRPLFGAHWRQRIGVALARGQAALVSSAVDKGRCHTKEIRG
eukprot:COSAG01_NODE_3296_length_6298_cov_2.497500_1_plen_64_part_10